MGTGAHSGRDAIDAVWGVLHLLCPAVGPEVLAKVLNLYLDVETGVRSIRYTKNQYGKDLFDNQSFPATVNWHAMNTTRKRHDTNGTLVPILGEIRDNFFWLDRRRSFDWYRLAEETLEKSNTLFSMSEMHDLNQDTPTKGFIRCQQHGSSSKRK